MRVPPSDSQAEDALADNVLAFHHPPAYISPKVVLKIQKAWLTRHEIDRGRLMGDTGRSLFDPSHPVTVPPAVHYGENSTRDLELLVGNLERALPGRFWDP